MSCLETILHTLATRPGRVIVRFSTLQERAAVDLSARHPDLPLRKQIEHWAAQHGLVACAEPGAAFVTFEKIQPHSIP